MGNLWNDGFDGYNNSVTGDLTVKWDGLNKFGGIGSFGFGTTSSTPPPYSGFGQYLQCTTVFNNGGYVFKNLNSSPLESRIVGGARIYVPTNAAANGLLIVGSNLGGGSNDPHRGALYRTSGGYLVWGSAAGVVATSGAAALGIGAWHYVEFDVTLSHTGTGILQIWVDGVSVYGPTSGLNTLSGISTCTQVGLWNGGDPGENTCWDDLYFDNNTRYGPTTEIRAYYMNGNGAISSTPWTASTPPGPPNWQCVDQKPTDPINTAKNVSSAVPGVIDHYAFDPSSYFANVNAVQVSALAYAPTPGIRTIQVGLRDYTGDINYGADAGLVNSLPYPVTSTEHYAVRQFGQRPSDGSWNDPSNPSDFSPSGTTQAVITVTG